MRGLILSMLLASWMAVADDSESKLEPQSEPQKFETTFNVSSSDHENIEGYFAGEDLALMVKPGSEVYNFLNRFKGQKVKLQFTEVTERTLGSISR